MIRFITPRVLLPVGVLLAGSLIAVSSPTNHIDSEPLRSQPLPANDEARSSDRAHQLTAPAPEADRKPATSPESSPVAARVETRDAWVKDAQVIQNDLLQALIAGEPGAIETARRRAAELARRTAAGKR